MAKKKVGHVELEAHGFKVLATCGKYYFIAERDGHRFRFIRQAMNYWHCFWECGATGSGDNPVKSMDGGLGDVIGTDAQLKRYESLERAMPYDHSVSWVRVS